MAWLTMESRCAAQRDEAPVVWSRRVHHRVVTPCRIQTDEKVTVECREMAAMLGEHGSSRRG